MNQRTNYPGKLIVLEGSDATGKDTHQAFIETLLSDANIDYLATRTIGGPPSSEAIRKVLLDTSIGDLSETTELFLYFAARLENLRLHVIPALAAGKWVLSNRYSYSTIAYQGVARGLGVEVVMNLCEMIHSGLWPDLVFLFDQSADTTLQRLRQQGGQDRIELSPLSFFEQVRQGYLAMLPGHSQPNSWNQKLFALAGYANTQFELVNSERDIPTIQQDIEQRLLHFIQQSKAA